MCSGHKTFISRTKNIILAKEESKQIARKCLGKPENLVDCLREPQSINIDWVFATMPCRSHR